MPLSTYNPGNKFTPTFTNSVDEQVKKERADRIQKYGTQKSKLEQRLQNMLNKSTCKDVESKDFFKTDNSIKYPKPSDKSFNHMVSGSETFELVKHPNAGCYTLHSKDDGNFHLSANDLNELVTFIKDNF